MTLHRLLLRLATASLLLTACGLFRGDANGVITGSGRVTSEARAISGVHSVVLEGQGDVLLHEGAAPSLTIEAEDNLLPLITSSVQDGTLRLGFDRATWRDTIRPTQPIRFLLTLPSLAAFDLAGSGTLQASSLRAEQLTLRLTGTGDLTIDQLEANSLDVRLDGTGDLTLAGAVDSQTVSLSGTGQYQAGDLASAAAQITLSGTGDAVVWVRDDLAILISGAGTVSYWGQPTVSRRDITGAGDINPMGVK
jgi:hypothetical protein